MGLRVGERLAARASNRPFVATLVASPDVSSEAAPPVATPPGEPDAELISALLAELDVSDGPLATFAKSYAHRVRLDRLEPLDPVELAAQVRGLYGFVDARRGEVGVRAINPTVDRDGYRTPGTVVEANTADAPFLIDSVSEALRARGLEVRHVVHPVMGVERSDEGGVRSVGPARGALHRESMMHFEVDRRVPDDQLDDLAQAVTRVLGDVRLCVRDFHAMVDRIDRMVEFAQAAVTRYPKDEVSEAVALLHWLRADNFVFLGYREYATAGEGDAATLQAVPGSGLGILSKIEGSQFAQPVPLSELPAAVRDRVLDSPLVIVSKTNREATVHRRVKMDYIGVRQVGEDGRLVGELRFVGLFTSKALMEPAREIPLIRRKLDYIMESEDLFPGSHDFKAVVSIFESFPKDELFASGTEDLRETVMALLGLQEKRHVQLFVRPDLLGRFVTATVALPRDRVSTELRLRLQNLLEERYHGESIDYHLSLGETDPARFHFMVHVPEGGIPDVSFDQLEREVLAARAPGTTPSPTRWWKATESCRARHWRAAMSGLFPDYYKSADADPHGPVRRRPVRVAGRRTPLHGRAPERGGHGGAADPAEAVQDRRQGAAVGPAAGAGGAGPDRGRGGADPAPGARGKRPLPARLRRARRQRLAARPRPGAASWWPTRCGRSGTAGPRATR